MLGKFCAISDAPYSAAVIGFLVYECVTLATADCGDIGLPAQTSGTAKLVVWGDSDPCESFSDACLPSSRLSHTLSRVTSLIPQLSVLSPM